MNATLLATGLWLLAADAGDDGAVREEVITARRSDADTVTVALDDVVAGGTGLLAVPGVALARDGGPLAPARPLLRGLGGARLAVDVAGLAFSDLVSGDVDVALLPLGLGVGVVDIAGLRAPPAGGALGGGFSVRPAAGSRLQLVVGDLGTLQGSLRLATPVEGGRVTSSVSAGTTRGDFPFFVVDADGTPGASLIRVNNDRRRLNVGVVADMGGPMPESVVGGRLETRVVAAGALHEGGIPGFATAPLLNLRGEQARGVVGGALTWRDGTRHLGASVDVTGERRRTIDDRADQADVDEVATLATGVGVGMGDLVWSHDGGRVIADVEARAGGAVVADAARRSEARAGARVVASGPLSADLAVDLRSELGLAVVDDVDVNARSNVAPAALPRALLTAALQRSDGRARAAVSVRHVTRAPTLDERFAPTGFVRGTPDLAPERVSDIEGRLGLVIPGRHAVRVDVAAFASHLEDAIVMVNRNAFEVAPENTGPARRAGVELGMRARPHPLLMVEQAATLLWSEVLATGAPLPTAPPLGLHSTVRLGTDDAFAGATVTGRGRAPSTIFGTLESGAFVLVDLRARLPLGDALAATFHVDNALDVRTARDQNLLPLPGRLAFVGLEVRP